MVLALAVAVVLTLAPDTDCCFQECVYLILANKQDLPGASPDTHIAEKLELHKIKNPCGKYIIIYCKHDVVFCFKNVLSI